MEDGDEEEEGREITAGLSGPVTDGAAAKGAGKAGGRPHIYNAAALHEKLEDISWPEGLEWAEAQALTLDAPPIEDIEDDLSRELSFYTQVRGPSQGTRAHVHTRTRAYESAGIT